MGIGDTLEVEVRVEVRGELEMVDESDEDERWLGLSEEEIDCDEGKMRVGLREVWDEEIESQEMMRLKFEVRSEGGKTVKIDW